jgi:hypothetical protein
MGAPSTATLTAAGYNTWAHGQPQPLAAGDAGNHDIDQQSL